MIKDKEIRDDWLYQEIKRESKISAWDFDEGNKIKQAHEEHCAREKVRREHEEVHVKSVRVAKTKNINVDNKKAALIGLIMFFVIATFIFVFVGSIMGGEFTILPMFPIFIFVFIAVISSITKKGGK